MRWRLLALLFMAALAPGAPGLSADDCAAQGACGRRIDGFRGARFGMTVEQVRAAVQRDFPGARLVPAAAPDATTQVLETTLIRLDPGPGPAVIDYIFDGASGHLTHVNVSWVFLVAPTDEERLAMRDSAVRLQRYFKDQPEKALEADDGGVVSPDEVLLYRAQDRGGDRIELVAHGVPFDRFENGKRLPALPLAGPAFVKISYFAGEHR